MKDTRTPAASAMKGADMNEVKFYDAAKRPEGSNADEWHLFIQKYADSRANGNGTGLQFLAVQIAEALDAAEGRYLSAVKGRQDFRNALRQERADASAAERGNDAEILRLQNEVVRRNMRLLDAKKVIKRCAEQFRFYEKNHRNKTPPDHARADVNGEYALMCEDELAAAPPGETGWRDKEGE